VSRLLKHAQSKKKTRSEFAQLVERMTNHQRSLWARRGYPGLRMKEIDRLKPFLGEKK